MRETRLSPELLQLLHALEAIRFPVRGSKVDCLVEVEAMIESSMVGLRESDDKLPRSLVDCIYANTSLLELLGSEKGHELE